MTPAFAARLAAAHDHSDSLLCVGLDPDPKRFPSGFPGMGTGSRPLIGSLLTPRRNTSALSSPKLPTLLPWGRRLRWKIASPPFATAHPMP